MSNQGLSISPLIQAIRQGNLHDVICALESGSDIEEADFHGQRGLPLRTACFSGKLDIIRELIRRGADVDAAGADGPGMPIRLALRTRNAEVARLLLASGASIPPGISIPEAYLTPPEPAPLPAPAPASEPLLLDVPPMEFTGVTSESTPADFIPQHGKVPADGEDANRPRPENYDIDEELEITGSYGVDTNVLNMDALRFEEESGHSSPGSDTQNEATAPKKRGFWKSGRPA